MPNENDKPFYDIVDSINLIHKKYPFIPIWIIRRVLFAEDLYEKSVGIIDWEPALSDWYYPRKYKKILKRFIRFLK